MAGPSTFNFTTGPAPLPDVGVLSYNGCIFSPLYDSNVSGRSVPDSANRTIKYMEYTLTVDGYVTLPDGQTDTVATMSTLRQLLTVQGGELIYTGRGNDLVVSARGDNIPKGALWRSDVAWGPIPEVLEFQPLGAGKSAKIKWQVKVHLFDQPINGKFTQFNYDTMVMYGEDGYSTISVRGSLEIPMKRFPDQKSRIITTTVDDSREEIDRSLMSQIDMTRFRITKREFPVSRDKRTMDWSFTFEELPYMDMPVNCTLARGTFSFRPAKAGVGLCMWLCTLRATYTVRADVGRRWAWFGFLSLLRLRMNQAVLGNISGVAAQNPDRGQIEAIKRSIQGAAGSAAIGVGALFNAAPGGGALFGVPLQGLGAAINANVAGANLRGPQVGGITAAAKLSKASTKAILIDLSGDEGLYLDSKTTTFSATWRLVTTLSHILLASGLWTKVDEGPAGKGNFWAASMADITGATSWLTNRLDPELDVIVDLGGP